ncbi:hypothetical protein KZZ52_33885 [Dactylosporangium sp. AC04546]|uniref:hypothetical protein n=1 Tax=Dactylosporangium sp. AC04546 TaxID=2862460 RepID=UPI001EDCA426|nr:hypothetical protein [Dactylosporangium sp. AC04546]WVK78965.1 hypothetical protein KZZ52_33885 [Dactylosporangium sp. AC04546]
MHGSTWWSGGRLYVTVSVKDTIANGTNAGAYLFADYNDGGTREEWLWNDGGAGTTRTATYSFAGNIKYLHAAECTWGSCRYMRMFRIH